VSKFYKNYISIFVTLFVFISIVLTVNSLSGIRDFRPKAVSQTSVTKEPGVLSNSGATGGISWSGPSNAKSNDGSYATVTANVRGGTNYSLPMQTYSYGFSIPTGSTIDKVEILIERKSNASGFEAALDESVFLVNNGSVQTINRCNSNCTSIPNSDSVITVELSGITLATINSGGFGVAYRAYLSYNSSPVTVSVDSINIKVTYTPPQPPTVSISADDTSIAYNGSTTIRWSSTNATSCSASGSWSGTKGTSGSQSTGNLTANKTYIITCSGAGGTSPEDSVTVNVGPKPPDSGGGSSGGGSSGGGVSGGGTTPSPISGVPSLPPPPTSIPGISVKIDPKIVNFLKVKLAIPYLAGTIRVPFLIGGFGQEVEVSPGTKEYQIDVRGAKFKLGSQLKIQAGGSQTLLTKKVTIKSKAPKQPVEFGDLWLGDLKGDNRVERSDLEEFFTFLKEGSQDSDINADSTMNSFDWAIILANFGKIGDR